VDGASGLATSFGVQLDAGDRFEVDVDAAAGTLVVSAALANLLGFTGQLEDDRGEILRMDADPASGRVVVRDLKHRLPERWSCAWLAWQDTGRFRLQFDPAVEPRTEEQLATEQGLALQVDPEDWTLVGTAPNHVTALNGFQLARQAVSLSTHGGFEQLICLPLVRDMELLDHQVRTAKSVLQRFRGRAMLCDEVGLGKTIEAGLILMELHLRGLARRVLILTPPSLVEQWQGELRRKFSLHTTGYDAPEFRAAGIEAWSAFDQIIVSMHTAKREPHRSAILRCKWDMVIIDEAHHLRNRNTQLWRFASELQKRYILLLTATPVQNNLAELFNLVTLLEPGLLSTSKQFQKRFVDRRDKLTPKNVDQLHELLAEVMVRNRRSTVGLQFTRRWARTERVTLRDEERRLYHDVTAVVREALRSRTAQPSAGRRGAGADGHGPSGGSTGRGLNRMVLLSLQMALGSSPAAAASTLSRLSRQSRLPSQQRANFAALAERGEGLREYAKAARLLELAREFPDKMVIFTQFLATQQMLSERLAAAGHRVAVFHGGLSRMEKEAAIERFRGPARLLLCSEAGSEGRNLQFAHAVCNFDLPWNPLKIEQRIGRLSRIGQQHDVHVFNLVSADTVEDAVLHLLDAKLAMFELVIGEIDMILGNLDEDEEFHDMVVDAWAASDDEKDFQRRMEDLGNRLLQAKDAYLHQRAHDDRLFGNRFAPDR